MFILTYFSFRICREMDRNYDDSISFDELFLFLFPDHNVALAREKKRLKVVGERVRKYRSGSAGDPVSVDKDGKAVLVSSGSFYDVDSAGRRKVGKKHKNGDDKKNVDNNKSSGRPGAYAVEGEMDKELRSEEFSPLPEYNNNAVKSFEMEG